jgi:hypothetical protein
MSDLFNALKFILETTLPDVVRGTVIVSGRPLATLEISGLNSGTPDFTMVTACPLCHAELTRDELNAETFDRVQEKVLRVQKGAAASHFQERHQ